MDPNALFSFALPEVMAWAVMLIALLIVYRQAGTASYLLYFLIGSCFYLLVIPSVVGTYDPIYGMTGFPKERYYGSVLVYCFFYSTGVYLTGRRALRDSAFELRKPALSNLKNTKYKIAYWSFFFVSAGLCAYSIASRNVFQIGGDFLFTILGFDFLLVCYLIDRPNRSSIVNLIFFSILALLFFYAGFRYRVALLVLTEVVVYISGRGSLLLKAGLLVGSMLMVFLLAAIGQVRSYGSFDTISRIAQVEFDLGGLISASGEQTLYFATVNVIEKLDDLDTVGFRPITVLFTHFIPSAVYPDKPRAEYLGAYLKVSEGLEGTGAAMHDVAQATLMFGHWGLPIAALMLGAIAGYILRFGLRLSPNRYYACCIILLFAIFVPSRGYLAQQVTWGLSFTLPIYLLNLGSRLTLRRKLRDAR